MRVLVTGATSRSARPIIRLLLAAGHDVVGLAPATHRVVDPRADLVVGPCDRTTARRAVDGTDVVLHLAHLPGSGVSDAAGEAAALGAAAAEAGIPVVLPIVENDPAGLAALRALEGARASTLCLLTPLVASRRADTLSCRTLLRLLAAQTHHEWTLLHSDDLDRHLVDAVREASAGRRGDRAAAASGVVSGHRVRDLLRVAGVPIPRPRRGTSGEVPRDPVAFAEAEGTTGWSSSEAIEDLARGLVGRRFGPDGARTRSGRLPLESEFLPARLRASDGHELVSAAPEGLEGEFDERMDPRFPVLSAANTAEALPHPLTPMSIDVHAASLRNANAAIAHMMALEGVVADEWNSRVNSVYGHGVFLNASISVLTAANLPGWDEKSMRRQAFSAIPEDWDLHPLGKPPVPAGLQAQRKSAVVVARMLEVARHYRESASSVQHYARTEVIEPTVLATLSDDQLVLRALLLRDRLAQAWTVSALGVIMTSAATAIHDRSGAGDKDLGVDLDALESARTVRGVERLASILRTDRELRGLAADGKVDELRSRSAAFARALDAELTGIGHRGPGECEFANPVFADRPDLLVTAAGNAASGARRDHVRGERATGATARLAVGATVNRERARDGVVRITHALRVLLRERGRRLATAGAIENAEDVFYLTLDEANAVPTDAAERISRRRAERERLAQIRMPDVFTGHWAPVQVGEVLCAGETITGLGVCGGVAEGPVTVLDDPDDEIEPGDVLVASVTDVGYTSMFAYAAAVVTDIGGSASHAAIVAREFGVPCVVDTKIATGRLRTGQRVRVDGSSGEITAL